MKNKKLNINLKNFILMVVSALILVTATVCWFFMTHNNTVGGFNTNVDNPSSHFIFYEAEDTNKNGVIDGDEEYVEIGTANIESNNMIPGKTYFYKVTVDNQRDNSLFGLFFNNIEETGTLSSVVEVTAEVKNSLGATVLSTNGFKILSTLMTTDDSGTVTDAKVLTGTGFNRDTYDVYYTVKMSTSATTEYEDFRISIDDVSASFYAG